MSCKKETFYESEGIFFYLDEKKICLFRSIITETKCTIEMRDQLKNYIIFY